MSEDRGIGLKGWIAGQKSKSGQTESKAEAVSLEKNRVAVLPLVNMISDPADEYFSDGMTEELISTLANISGLTVISRTSIMQYKNAGKKAAEIGRDLMAGTIIEGSVRKAGNRVRISMQLIDSQEDKHLWAENYDRELEDVFAVQADIARNVAEALKVKLLPRESVQVERKATHNMEAYTLYLRGRYHWNKRSKESVSKAIEYFRSAISRDSAYALAYAGLADCYNIAADWSFMSPEDAYAKAETAALKALKLDSNLAEAHAALALCSAADWNWADAEAEFRRAIELNPNYASARQWHSMLLAALGRTEESLVEVKKASEIDPLSPVILNLLGRRLEAMKEYILSEEQYRKALEIDPDFYFSHAGIAISFAKRSMCGEALAECQKIDSIEESELLKLDLAYVYALCGNQEKANVILQGKTKLEDRSRSLIMTAWVYSALGEREKAIEVLQRGYESQNPFIHLIGSMDFDNLLFDQRFIELQKKTGLRK